MEIKEIEESTHTISAVVETTVGVVVTVELALLTSINMDSRAIINRTSNLSIINNFKINNSK